MESEHDNRHEDRRLVTKYIWITVKYYIFRWNFKCCSAADTCYHDCHYSPYINDYDEPMDYTVQDGYVITGLESEHSNSAEDRRWRLQLCKIVPC